MKHPLPENESALHVIYLEITGNCTFRCRHCGNEGNTGSLEVLLVKRIMEEFRDLGGRKVILTGGEPLLHPELEEILDIVCDPTHTTKISTNAYLLQGPQHDFVFKYDVGFRVSLDGPREVHNRIRGNPQAYDALVTAMKKMSEQEKQIVVRTTIIQENKDALVPMLHDLDDLTKKEDIDIYSINLWPVRDIGKASQAQLLTGQEYACALRTVTEGTKDLHPSFRIIIGPTFGQEKAFEGGPIQQDEIYTCDILRSSLHIAVNADAYPCSFVHYPLGNVKEGSLAAIFSSKKAAIIRGLFHTRAHEDCVACDARPSCKGGCVAETFRELPFAKDIYCRGPV